MQPDRMKVAFLQPEGVPARRGARGVPGSGPARRVALLAAGNAAIYRRDDVVCLPVPDLPPCRLAVMWRTTDRRRAVRVVADTCCRCMAADQQTDADLAAAGPTSGG